MSVEAMAREEGLLFLITRILSATRQLRFPLSLSLLDFFPSRGPLSFVHRHYFGRGLRSLLNILTCTARTLRMHILRSTICSKLATMRSHLAPCVATAMAKARSLGCPSPYGPSSAHARIRAIKCMRSLRRDAFTYNSKKQVTRRNRRNR